MVKQLVTVAALESAALALALRQQYAQQLILIELLQRARHVSLVYAAGQLANRSLIWITNTVAGWRSDRELPRRATYFRA